MRRLRQFSILLFIIVLAVFLVFRFREKAQKDGSGPDISMGSGTIEVSVTDGEDVLLSGITANDRRDGDVTDSLVVENISTFLRPATRIVTYAAFDRENHVTRAQRELVYTDYRSPEFSITEPLTFPAGTTDILENVSVSDCLDGDLTDSVKILAEKSLTVDVAGNYEVKLQAANSAGDVETLPVVVTFTEGRSEELRIVLNNYVLYLPQGSEFDPHSVLKEIWIGGTAYQISGGYGTFVNGENNTPDARIGTNMIGVDNPVDTSTPGNYRVNYSLSIEKSNGTVITGLATLYVVVR